MLFSFQNGIEVIACQFLTREYDVPLRQGSWTDLERNTCEHLRQEALSIWSQHRVTENKSCKIHFIFLLSDKDPSLVV